MNLKANLAQLEAAQLVRRADDAELTFAFKHALTQESTYESLLRTQRAELHRRIAQAYEALYVDRLDEIVALLAQHYAEAGDDAKTFEYSNRAGHAAMRVYASAEALAHFTRAIDAARRLEPHWLGNDTDAGSRLTDCYLRRGRVLEMTGQFQKATQNYEELESLALSRKDSSMQLAALVALATIYSTATTVTDSIRARKLSNHALELAREIGDRKAQARVLWNLMLLSTLVGEMPQAIEYAEQSLAISRELGMREQTALTLNDISRPYLSVGQFDRAYAATREALAYFRETNNQPMLADNLGRLAAMHVANGQFDQMLEAAQEAQKISETIGNLWGQSFSRLFMGPVYFARGEISRALELMRDCIRFAEQSGFLIPQVKVRSEIASLYGALGNVHQGIELAEQAHAFAIEHIPSFECKACTALARLYTLSGDLVQAEANLKQGYATLREDFAQQMDDQLPVADVEIALARRDYARAIKTADEACERFGKMGYHISSAEVLYLKGNALDSLGNETEAGRVFIQSKVEAEKIGSRWMLWQIHATLGERTQAREMIQYIVKHCPADLGKSFLNLPKVKSIL